jgi:predicted nuclease of predicted toxin-antitoxin system
LNKRANVKNAYFDLGLPRQCEDEEIYQKAIEDNRFVVTINFDDFNKLIKRAKPGIIGIPSQLTNADMDALLAKFVSLNRVEDCVGKAIKIPLKELGYT